MPLQIVIDTNVLISALRSQQGASFRLLSLIGESSLFEINISVPLVLEYEDVTKRYLKETGLTQKDVNDIIDYLCSIGNRHRIYFLWRPLLKDPKDDMILELAVEAQCDYIISFNKRDFVGIQQFDLQILTPQEFLKIIGEIS
jgi:putative PIN family toxin of toxin-antitoxin system